MKMSRFNLSRALYPPTKNPAHSVIINYCCFHNETVDETYSYLDLGKLCCILSVSNESFQFMSCIFCKPEPLCEQKVHVTLDATECLDHGPTHTESKIRYLHENASYTLHKRMRCWEITGSEMLTIL